MKGEILFQEHFSQSNLVSFPKGKFNDLSGTLDIWGYPLFNESLLESENIFYFEVSISCKLQTLCMNVLEQIIC